MNGFVLEALVSVVQKEELYLLTHLIYSQSYAHYHHKVPPKGNIDEML